MFWCGADTVRLHENPLYPGMAIVEGVEKGTWPTMKKAVCHSWTYFWFYCLQLPTLPSAFESWHGQG